MWHIDTLLQMSEILAHQGGGLPIGHILEAFTYPPSFSEQGVAADLIERSLFAFERSFSSGFNVTLGTHRLDFDRIENRPFFLGLHRHIQFAIPPLTPRSKI